MESLLGIARGYVWGYARVMREPMRQYNFRAPAQLWEAAQEAADANGETVADVLRRALETYVEETNR